MARRRFVVLMALLAMLSTTCSRSERPVAPQGMAPAVVEEPVETTEVPVADTQPAEPAPVTEPTPPAESADDPRPVGVSARTQSKPTRAGKPQPIGSIEIPAIGLSHAIYEGIDLAIINYGPSHWPGTAMPGEPGNSVFPGHRTTYSRPFWDIDRLRAGDHVTFTTAAGKFTYRVTETFVVDENATWITNTTAEATFTIFACHPKGSARQRYVVKGNLLSSATTTTTPATTTTTSRGLIPGVLG